MSRTAGLGSGDYVAINTVAIVALILGLASIPAMLFQLMILVAVAAVVCGVVALVQISSSNGTQTGRAFAVGGILLGLGFGGAAVGRIIMDRMRERRDEQAIDKLVNRLSDLIVAKQYSQAYQTLFSENFRKEFGEQEFTRQWEMLVTYAGPVKSIGWGKRAEFDYQKATNTTRAGATSEFTFEKMPARQPIGFVKVGDGEWEIEGIKQLFEKQQDRPGGGGAPAVPDYGAPQGPQLPGPTGPPPPPPQQQPGPGPA
jgi:hypothetical protein